MGTQFIANATSKPWIMMTRDGVALGITDLSLAADWDTVAEHMTEVVRGGHADYQEALDVADILEGLASVIRSAVRGTFRQTSGVLAHG